jgi:hypothetical protein
MQYLALISGNMSGLCPAFQNIPVFRLNAERSYSEDRPDAWPSCPDVDLIRIELCCFRKDIIEDHPDVDKLPSGGLRARV